MELKQIFYNWINSWLDMICGLISVLTFTYYRPWWDFKFCIWSSKKQVKRIIEAKK